MRRPPLGMPSPAGRRRRGTTCAKSVTIPSMNPYVLGLGRGVPAVVQRVLEDAVDASDRCRRRSGPARCRACAAGRRPAPRPRPSTRRCPRSPGASGSARAAARGACPSSPRTAGTDPALHASPSARVATSFGISRITSRIASIDGTDPPGEWIQREMSEASSSAASASSCVAIRVPLSSSSGPSSTSTRWWNSSRRASAPNCGIFPSSAMPPACLRARGHGIRFRRRRIRRQRSGLMPAESVLVSAESALVRETRALSAETSALSRGTRTLSRGLRRGATGGRARRRPRARALPSRARGAPRARPRPPPR